MGGGGWVLELVLPSCPFLLHVWKKNLPYLPIPHLAMWGEIPPRTDWWGPLTGICQGVQEIAHLAGCKFEDKPAWRHVLCLPHSWIEK